VLHVDDDAGVLLLELDLGRVNRVAPRTAVPVGGVAHHLCLHLRRLLHDRHDLLDFLRHSLFDGHDLLDRDLLLDDLLDFLADGHHLLDDLGRGLAAGREHHRCAAAQACSRRCAQEHASRERSELTSHGPSPTSHGPGTCRGPRATGRARRPTLTAGCAVGACCGARGRAASIRQTAHRGGQRGGCCDQGPTLGLYWARQARPRAGTKGIRHGRSAVFRWHPNSALRR